MSIQIQKIPAVILAGGLASRMGGGDKSLLKIGELSILDRVFSTLQPQVAEIVINANGDPSRFDKFPASVIADDIAGHVGPLAGILAGMDWATNFGAKQIVSVAADTPFLPKDLVSKLISGVRKEGADIGLAMTTDKKTGRKFRHPTVGLWPVSLRDELRQSLVSGLRKVVMWTDQYSVANVVFDKNGLVDPFFNINTPEDFQKAEQMAKGID